MDPVVLILIVVAVIVVAGVGGYLFSRSRSLEAPGSRPEVEAKPSKDSSQIDAGVSTDADEELAEPGDVEVVEDPVEVAPEPEPATFRSRLGKARSAMSGYLGSILGRGDINAETWEELEEALIRADVGVPTTMALLDSVRTKVEADDITEPAQLIEYVKDEMKLRLGEPDSSLALGGDPSVWLFVGVNGVGKTTTIGKIATREVAAGKNVVLAAGDTFRAAAAEQLQMWGERSGAHVVRGADGGDPSSVIFDAVEHAASADADVVLADTAGRLHTKTNLMKELEKVRRVAEKGAGTVTETLLVIDATTGQNGLVQAREFTAAADLTGVVLTKLDGSAKGGIVVAVQEELGLPVKLVGLGEGAADLVTFDADDFVDALFEQ